MVILGWRVDSPRSKIQHIFQVHVFFSVIIMDDEIVTSEERCPRCDLLFPGVVSLNVNSRWGQKGSLR